MAVGISIDIFSGFIILRLYLLLARSAGPHLNRTQGIGSNATEIKPKVLRAQAPVRLVNTGNHISIRLGKIGMRKGKGGILLWRITRGSTPARARRMVAAIVRAERVPAGGYASKRYATNDI